MLNLSGLYMIRCRTTGEYYIGSTARAFRLRFSEHRTQLARGVCTIPRLQEVATRYGVDDLDFVPLKVLCEAERDAREKEAIAQLRPTLNVDGARPRARYDRWEPITVGGRTMTIYEAAREFDLEHNTIRYRVKRGLTGDELVAPPYKAPSKTPRKPYIRRK